MTHEHAYINGVTRMQHRGMKVVSFDFGHANLAMVCADIDETSYDVTVTHSSMTNLKHMRCHDGCMFEKRNRRTAHLTYHFVQSIAEHLEEADVVIGEAQPITGLTDVQECIFIWIMQAYSRGRPNYFRLINPSTMHRAFDFTANDKVARRVEVVDKTRHLMEDQVAWKRAKEKDHLGDACAYALYFAEFVVPEEQRAELAKGLFDKFRFI